VLSEALKGHKQPTQQAQSTQLLESLSSRIQTAIANLQSASATEEVDALWEKADHAKRELALVANSLKPLKESPERHSVVNEMRKLECNLNEFITTLPKDRWPLYYDSGKDIGFLHHLKR
jgi:predicted  nucleic acid-binding Zn-ribbon protein